MRRHARRRAAERYGLQLGRSTRTEIVGLIANSQATLVERQSLRVAVYDVTMADGYLVRVVYDRKRHELVTFLPRPVATAG
jgi:hypothetical protein